MYGGEVLGFRCGGLESELTFLRVPMCLEVALLVALQQKSSGLVSLLCWDSKVFIEFTGLGSCIQLNPTPRNKV